MTSMGDTLGAAGFDHDVIQQKLALGQEPSLQRGFLPESAAQPEAYLDGLMRWWNARRRSQWRSQPGHTYRLFDDLLAGDDGSLVLLLRDHAGHERDVTRAELRQRASQLAALFRHRGVGPGCVVALVPGPGLELALGLLACLRLGATAALVPLAGPAAVHFTLAAMEATHVAASSRSHTVPDSWQASLLPLELDGATAADGGPAASYGVSDPVLMLPSPFVSDSRPVMVAAGALHRQLVRDLALVWQLQPGDRLAVPGWSPRRHQPTLLLLCLLAGAAFVQTAPGSNLRGVVADLGITHLGLNLEQGPSDLGWWQGRRRFAIIDLAGEQDVSERLALEQRLTGSGARVIQLLHAAPAGGTLLFTPPRDRPAGFRVFPVPGLVWATVDPGGGPGLPGAGVLTPALPDPEAAAGQYVVSEADDALLFGGALAGTPGGCVLPRQLVLEAASDDPAVLGAGLVQQPARRLNGARFVLVLCVDPFRSEQLQQDPGSFLQKHAERLGRALGSAFAPDRLEAFPVMPAPDDAGQPSVDWIEAGYLDGSLARRSRDGLLQRLSRLRALVTLFGRESATPPPPSLPEAAAAPSGKPHLGPLPRKEA